MKIPSIGVLSSLVLVFASVSWASTSSCATTATLASYGTGTGSGCYDIDKSFTNFSVVNSGTLGTVQTTATDQITGANTFVAVNTPWTVSSSFTPTTAANWQATSAGGTNATLTATINMLVNSSAAFIAQPSPNNQYPTPDPGQAFFISNASISSLVGLTGDSNKNGTDSITITETLCVGTGACTASTQIVLTASIPNNSSTVTYTCTVGVGAGATCGSASSASPILATFTSNITTLNVTNQYNLLANDHGGTGTTDTLTSFADAFGEFEGAGPTPEPSTFVLIGTALTGVGFLRRRKLKRSI